MIASCVSMAILEQYLVSVTSQCFNFSRTKFIKLLRDDVLVLRSCLCLFLSTIRGLLDSTSVDLIYFNIQLELHDYGFIGLCAVKYALCPPNYLYIYIGLHSLSQNIQLMHFYPYKSSLCLIFNMCYAILETLEENEVARRRWPPPSCSSTS
jgi:hypothetical protein